MASTPFDLTLIVPWLTEYYENKPVGHTNAQGNTVRHIKTVTPWQGEEVHVKHLLASGIGARIDSDLEAVAPEALAPTALDVSINKSNLRRISATAEMTIASLRIAAKEPVQGLSNLGQMLIRDIDGSITMKEEQALQSDGDSKLAAVATAGKYKDDGDTYPGGSATTCFIKITGGSISSFRQGMKLSIRAGTASTVRVTGTVTYVCFDEYMYGRNVGPGIALTYAVTGSDAHFDNVVAGDEIVAYGESTGTGFPCSFSALCDFTSSPAAYFDAARTTSTNRFLLAHGRPSVGTLSLVTHFGAMANLFGRLIPADRAIMEGQGVELTDALICQTGPELCQVIERLAGDASSQFTKEMFSSIPAAKQAKLIAAYGWEGAVLHSSCMPPLAIQRETLMNPQTIRVWDPNAWEMLRVGGKSAKPYWWGEEAGSVWQLAVDSTTHRNLPKYQATCEIVETVVCSQPETIYEFQGVTG